MHAANDWGGLGRAGTPSLSASLHAMLESPTLLLLVITNALMR